MGSQGSFLPYGRQSISEDDIEAVVGVLRGDWLTQGPAVEAFEHAVADKVGARHAVACANGTAALHLAALALGLGPGDAVIVPAVTFLATANAARFVGAEVVFADVDPDTGLMQAAHAQDALERAESAGLKPRAVFPVHLAGQTAWVGAPREGIAVVEDACHALGTKMTDAGCNSAVGSCKGSDMAVFSFHPVKTVATGEGGMVVTNDDRHAQALRLFRSHGMSRDAETFAFQDQAFDSAGAQNPWYYEMAEFGFNYRLPDLNCALGLSQLGRLDQFVARRQQLVERYREALRPLAPLVRPLETVPGCSPGWHLMVALVDFEAAGRERGQVMQAMRGRGIGTQVHYLPLYRQPYYERRYGRQRLPGAEAYYARALSLPLFPDMTDGDVERVVSALSEALGQS